MASPPTEIRKGKVLQYNGAPHLVLDVQHRTQGRQAGFLQVSMRNLENGASTNTKFRTTDTVEILHTETRKLEFTYADADGYHFMDPGTFEDTVLDTEVIGSSKDFLIENNVYDILHIEDRPIQLELPAALEMKVVESPEGVRGDTATKVQKPATVETGITVHVPLFIKEGETIKVNTADRSYMGRA